MKHRPFSRVSSTVFFIVAGPKTCSNSPIVSPDRSRTANTRCVSMYHLSPGADASPSPQPGQPGLCKPSPEYGEGFFGDTRQIAARHFHHTPDDLRGSFWQWDTGEIALVRLSDRRLEYSEVPHPRRTASSCSRWSDTRRSMLPTRAPQRKSPCARAPCETSRSRKIRAAPSSSSAATSEVVTDILR